MDTTIRNLDEVSYKELKAKAALTGKTIGETINEAIQQYLESPRNDIKRTSLRDLIPEDYPEGNDRLSQDIDKVLFDS